MLHYLPYLIIHPLSLSCEFSQPKYLVWIIIYDVRHSFKIECALKQEFPQILAKCELVLLGIQFSLIILIIAPLQISWGG